MAHPSGRTLSIVEHFLCGCTLAGLSDLKVKAEGDVMTGVNILRRALEEPMRGIAENAGMDGSVIVSTILRLTEAHADRWLEVRGSHDVPAYGFERVIDPPPLEINIQRLLEEFAKGRLNVGDEWTTALSAENARLIHTLSEEAAGAVEQATRADVAGDVTSSRFITRCRRGGALPARRCRRRWRPAPRWRRRDRPAWTSAQM